MKALWSEDAPRYQGKYFSITDGGNHPKPLQQPGPPIMLGGSAPSILKLAAEHARILNIIPPTSNGKDFPNDPAATVRFTMDVMKKKIATLGDLMQALLSQRSRLGDYFMRSLREQVEGDLARRDPPGAPLQSTTGAASAAHE